MQMGIQICSRVGPEPSIKKLISIQNKIIPGTKNRPPIYIKAIDQPMHLKTVLVTFPIFLFVDLFIFCCLNYSIQNYPQNRPQLRRGPQSESLGDCPPSKLNQKKYSGNDPLLLLQKSFLFLSIYIQGFTDIDFSLQMRYNTNQVPLM